MHLLKIPRLDIQTIRNAVQRAGRVLILQEDTFIGGIGREIAAWMAENWFSIPTHQQYVVLRRIPLCHSVLILRIIL